MTLNNSLATYSHIIIFLYKMEIIYTSISKNNKSPVCEYTDYSGNFPQIAIKILKKTKSSSRGVVDYERYLV